MFYGGMSVEQADSLSVEHPDIYAAISSRAELAHIQSSTYTPGMSKPVPLTKSGLGYGEIEEKNSAIERAVQAAKEMDEKWL